MRKTFNLIKENMQQGRDVMLVSIIGNSGSAPRGSGAHMLVGAEGRIHGTIGGGAVEFHALNLAAEALSASKSIVKSYRLNKNQIEDIGMVCGGDVRVYFQYIAADDVDMPSLCDLGLELLDLDEDIWMIFSFESDDSWKMGFFSHKRGLMRLDIPMEGLIPRLANKSEPFTFAEQNYYIEPINRAGRVLIFGGGHVSQELAPLLAHLDFRCVVIEDRPEFADKDLFPGVADTYVHDFEQVVEHFGINANDYVVIMTRGHANDYEILVQVLRGDTAYTGVIGSRVKIKVSTEKLLADGISLDKINTVYWPIGLEILAETPAEIAVSVAGEMLRVRGERMGKRPK